MENISQKKLKMIGEMRKMNDILIALYKNNITLNITQLKEGYFYGLKIQLEQRKGDLPVKRMYHLISLRDIELLDGSVNSDKVVIEFIKDMIKEMVGEKEDEE